MSFFKSSKKAEDVKQGGSNHIISSGLYPVSVIAPVVNVSQNGSTTVDLYVEHAGQKQIIYGNLRITNNDGSSNKIGAKTFNQLVIIAGLDDVAEPIEAELPIGKKEALKTVAVLEDLADIDVMMRIQMEYSVYNNDIKEKKIIKSFFRASDNASAEEIVNEDSSGQAYVKDMKYADNVTYKDGLTAEAVASWIAKQRPKGTGGSGATAEGTGSAAPSFGNRRFGKSED